MFCIWKHCWWNFQTIAHLSNKAKKYFHQQCSAVISQVSNAHIHCKINCSKHISAHFFAAQRDIIDPFCLPFQVTSPFFLSLLIQQILNELLMEKKITVLGLKNSQCNYCSRKYPMVLYPTYWTLHNLLIMFLSQAYFSPFKKVGFLFPFMYMQSMHIHGLLILLVYSLFTLLSNTSKNHLGCVLLYQQIICS